MILPIFAQHKWGGGPRGAQRLGVEGASPNAKPLRQAACGDLPPPHLAGAKWGGSFDDALALAIPAPPSHEDCMTNKEKTAAAIAGAVGSAALAAALLYTSKRKEKKKAADGQAGPIPSGEAPQSD